MLLTSSFQGVYAASGISTKLKVNLQGDHIILRQLDKQSYDYLYQFSLASSPIEDVLACCYCASPKHLFRS